MKILVYDDNPDFGGHQIMACRGIEALAAEPTTEVVGMINPANQKLAERLVGIQTLDADAERIHTLNPDLVLCVQGDIAQSTAGVRAARAAGVECASYIAIPHRLADMGAKLGALRDLRNRRLFNQPDRFITISESMKALLIERGTKKPIAVVPNGIPAPPIPAIMERGATTTLAVVGRIEFKQKRQDFLVRAFQARPDRFKNCRLMFFGDGPDARPLDRMIADVENISRAPWSNDIEAIYGMIDFLIIPSRYEGVPLVMLEALARGVPVLGSARDGMKDVLPPEWTFAPENADALAAAFSNARDDGIGKIAELQMKVLAENSIEAFNANFVRAVSGQ